MTPAQKAEYRELLAAQSATINVRDWLRGEGIAPADLDAATIAALWRALEIASKGMSKEALKRMVFGDKEVLHDVIDSAEAALLACVDMGWNSDNSAYTDRRLNAAEKINIAISKIASIK